MIGSYQDILFIEQAPQPNEGVASTYALLERSARQYTFANEAL
ncbi:hypothetical protein [Pseudomonas sp. B28(2017)]|nr:hypothetical protein [Pseudomonas sp. B28(2017)]